MNSFLREPLRSLRLCVDKDVEIMHICRHLLVYIEVIYKIHRSLAIKSSNMLLPTLDLQIFNPLAGYRLDKSSRQLQIGKQRNGKIHGFSAYHIIVR